MYILYQALLQAIWPDSLSDNFLQRLISRNLPDKRSNTYRDIDDVYRTTSPVEPAWSEPAQNMLQAKLTREY